MREYQRSPRRTGQGLELTGEKSGIKDLRLNDSKNSYANLEPVRDSMHEHYYAPSFEATRRARELKSQEAERRDAHWQTKQQWDAAVVEAIANPIERPIIPRRLARHRWAIHRRPLLGSFSSITWSITATGANRRIRLRQRRALPIVLRQPPSRSD